MASPSPDRSGPRDARERDLLERELERRLVWFSQADESEFGEFTRLDWWICWILFFAVPIVIVWWAA